MQCRSCDAPNLVSVIQLGELPLANALLKSNKSILEKKYNLEVLLCQNCGLAQLQDLIDPINLFTDYVYFSSNSDTMLQSATTLTNKIMPTLNSESFVVEIASNDGYLLKNYVSAGIKSLGIDPAQNIAQQANTNGIPTLCAFFNNLLANTLVKKYEKADIIHANNVMAHVPDINDFIKGLHSLLKPTGKCIIEVPYFLDLIKKLEFDTIYHEHVYYFSVKPLVLAFKRHNLDIYEIEKLDIHGGTLRLFVGHQGARPISSTIEEFLDLEIQGKLYSLETYLTFMQKLSKLKKILLDTLMILKEQGQKIAAYGASAKGTTLLNYFGIGQEILDFVVDRSKAKQGLYTPGTHLSIYSPEALIENKINYALLLSWNFADEIIQQQELFKNKFGKFIIPLPEVIVT